MSPELEAVLSRVAGFQSCPRPIGKEVGADICHEGAESQGAFPIEV